MSKQTKQQRNAKAVAIKKTRRDYSAAMEVRYYRTPVKRSCRCASCGRKLHERRDDMVFRKAGPVTLCVPCADRDPLISYRLSVRADRKLAAERKRR